MSNKERTRARLSPVKRYPVVGTQCHSVPSTKEKRYNVICLFRSVY